MDPVGLIVDAAAVGAAAAVKATAARVVKDAYSAFKALFNRKYGGVDLAAVERAPQSKKARANARRQIRRQAPSAADDAELLDIANQLIDLVRKNDPETAAVIGVDLHNFNARGVRLEDVASKGTGVRIAHAGLTQDIVIKHVRAGVGDVSDPKVKT